MRFWCAPLFSLRLARIEALRVWIERAAKSEISGDDDAPESRGILQHRAAWGMGNLGGMVEAIGLDAAVVVTVWNWGIIWR